ncbi:MAG: hypothetical protein IJG24_01760 [Selenomonadaceae bacterium]|nr:hypothetical protein [Selenomonadaceae bacterium]
MRSEDLIPQEYFDEIMPSLLPPKRERTANELDSIARGAAIDARNFGRQFPRYGQPSMDAPLIEWYREKKLRWRLMVEELEAKA